MVTFSVGALSAFDAVGGAYAENLPVILTSGAPNSNDHASSHLLHHTLGTRDLGYQIEMARHVTCAAVSITTALDAPGMIDHAIGTVAMAPGLTFSGTPTRTGRSGSQMRFFLVTMSHPDGEGWSRHLDSHMQYLKGLLRSGSLRASGPLKGMHLRPGFLVFAAEDESEVEAIVAKDPFAIEGLIETLSLQEWDPVLGAFHDESSRSLPAWAEQSDDTWRLASMTDRSPSKT